MNLMNEIITQQGLAIAKKLESLMRLRLIEVGHDLSDSDIKERCSIVIHELDPLRELWIDKGTDNEELIAYFTDTVIKQKEGVDSYTLLAEFEFAPMPKKYSPS